MNISVRMSVDSPVRILLLRHRRIKKPERWPLFGRYAVHTRKKYLRFQQLFKKRHFRSEPDASRAPMYSGSGLKAE